MRVYQPVTFVLAFTNGIRHSKSECAKQRCGELCI